MNLCKAVLIAVVILVLGQILMAGQIEPKFASYLSRLDDDDFVSAIVYLRDRPNIRELDRQLHSECASLAVRHARVIEVLRRAAERSQPDLINYLEAKHNVGTVKGYTPYWITNMIVVSATKAELEQIAKRADVEAIEPNFRATLIEEARKPYLGSPTAGIGVTNSLKAINADRVWYELGITGAGTLVANLDTGVDGSHPALSSRWRGNWHPWNECWRDALGTGTTFPADTHGHGTHTMGTICGADHATGDTIGVAFDALWIADNSINQSVGPEFDNDVLGAFQWFVDPDGNPETTDDVPDVLQNSWGIDSRFGYDYQDCDYRWQEAIENCEAAGVVVVFSAGNEGPSAQTLRSPATICKTPTVNFSVGAVDCENYGWPYPIAYFSSRGPSDCDGVSIKPEVSAPGVDVYSSYPGGSYTRMSGTSMAGPHVSGVVALMRQANPNADVQTIKQILMDTARDLGTAGEDNTYGWGVIDAYQAVLAVMAPDTTPPTVTVVAPNGGETLTVGTTYTIRWDASDDRSVVGTSIYYSYDGGATYTFIDSLTGNPGSYDWTVPNTPSSNCLVRILAYDGAGNRGLDVSDGYFTIEEAAGPYVWVSSIDLKLVTKGKSTYAQATVLVLDQDNNPVARASVHSHWDGLTQDSDVFNTKRKGTGSCNSDKLKNPVGWWYYYIDDVVKSGYAFRSDLSEISDAIYAGGTMLSPAVGGAIAVEKLPNEPAFVLSVPSYCHVSFVIYNVMGRKIRTLMDTMVSSGQVTIRWDGKDEAGETLPNGIYFYRAISGGHVTTNKFILMR